MIPGYSHILKRTLVYYRKPFLYQVAIIALLSAVITGSLLTGGSVRNSLKRSAFGRLGNTGIVISSGTRYIDQAVVSRLNDSLGTYCTGILETRTYCQGLSSQKSVTQAALYAVTDDFFRFQGIDSVLIKSGEAAINSKLAGALDVVVGDEIILRFGELTDIPADAPFATANEEANSIVLKVGSILDQQAAGNFSLSVSQIIPVNVFMRLDDLPPFSGNKAKINRILVSEKGRYTASGISSFLSSSLKPSDIGLMIRMTGRDKKPELISDRIFIDNILLGEIEKAIPSSAPVLTYLANSISLAERSVPYSFVSALPPALYPESPTGDEIIINKWLADDLKASTGDEVVMAWYSPDSLNKLVEKRESFKVKGIVGFQGIWADSLLMPSFPGISGSESCSDWDA